ncbi:hypothetical protein Y590_25315 (plasmid) [Methylobacterium sp. AMS5]|nr:hypothetical protein Y590_25315 [Methylobacterium sp. AMS5]
MMAWFRFWVNAALTAQGLSIAYWTAVSNEAADLIEKDLQP